MTILITGAGGFVGLNLVERLLADGHKVVSFSRNPLDARAMALFATLPGTLTCVAGDVRDAAVLADAVRDHGVSALVHMAAVTADGAREQRAAASVIEVNLVGLAHAMAAAAAGGARFVYTGSIAVFGPDTADGAINDEAAPHDPRTLYAITKSAGEAMVARLGAIHGLDWAIVRLGRIFGPWEHETGVRDTMSQIWQATMAARAGDPVRFARPCLKNWSYARDTAADLAALLAAPDWSRRVWNMGTPHAFTLAAWCERLAARFPDFRWAIGNGDGREIDLWGGKDGALLSWQAFAEDFAPPPPRDLDTAFDDYMAFLEGLTEKDAA